MDWIKKVWNDPVWSKVIAGVILAVGAAVYSVVKGWLSDTETISDVLQVVFTYKVNIWLALAAIILFLIISVARSNKKDEDIPVPPFVKDFTENFYINHVWTWRWQWSTTEHFYYIEDLGIRCSNCKNGKMTEGQEGYMCAKCGGVVPYENLGIDPEVVLKQILADARDRYSYCAEYIGEIKSGYIKA